MPRAVILPGVARQWPVLLAVPEFLLSCQALGELMDEHADTLPPWSRTDLVPEGSTGDAPLTRDQERLWFLDRLDPGDPALHISTTSRLTGPLDTDRLRQALAAVVARHESLRTRFVEHDGVPAQQVQPARAVPVEFFDATGPDPEAAARVWLGDLLARPFDLSAGYLLRVGLVRLDADEHVLCTVVHHIIGDGWSMGLLYRDLTAAYNGSVATDPPPPYREHARAQRGRAADPALLEFWRDRLADPPVLALPTDRPRPPVKTSTGGAVLREFTGAQWRAVQDFARAERCTPFMVLLTAYQLLLSQYTGQDDLCIGTPVAGRDRVELENVFGYFTGVVVMRADLRGEPTVRDLLRRTRSGFMQALAHKDIPFEELTAALDLPRDLSRNAVFQTTFTLHSTHDLAAVSGAEFGGLHAEQFDPHAPHVTVDLAVDVATSATAMDVLLSYNADLFDAATIEGLAQRYAAVLEQVLGSPESAVSALPLVSDATREALLAQGTGAPLGEVTPVPALVTAAAQATPDALALVCGAETVTYRELVARASGWADLLRDSGVRPGQLVGVSLPRGTDLIAALLGCQLARCGYLPLEPDLPSARHSALLLASGAAAVVTPAGLTTTGAVSTVDDPAYAMFTSGSTGTPKGVLVPARALAERVAWMTGGYQLRPGDRVVQFAGIGFDTHAEEIWPTLAAGATLVLLPDGAHSLPEVLAADPAITVLDLPTAYWQALLELAPDWPPALRLVILGGQQVDAAAVARWRTRFGDSVRLVNTYGPTEATIIATATDLGAADESRVPPIGAPIGGVRAYVLDRYGRLVPPGAVGELCLAGTGLAAGYLGDPESPAFTTDPFGTGRMYRTGDRARWRAGQPPTLEFLGRADRQLKIRGVRVEPGEVESILTSCPGVRAAAVVGVQDTLVGYVAAELPAEQVREFAAQRLPALYVPSVVVVLPELPLTRNGKLDLRALPAPQVAEDTDFRPPEGDAEALVAEVWAQLLHVDRVGRDDDFFALGGHSLLATRVVARLRVSLDLDLPVRAIFANPTLAGFAASVESALIAEIDQLSDAEAARLAADIPPPATDIPAHATDIPVLATYSGGAA